MTVNDILRRATSMACLNQRCCSSAKALGFVVLDAKAPITTCFVMARAKYSMHRLPRNTHTGCRHQTSLIAGTFFQGTKLPLTIWFLAIYLISQAKTGLSALALGFNRSMQQIG